MDKYAIIVAGGEGHRAGGDIPKQFRDICGMPMLWWSLKAFRDEDPRTKLLLVLHPGYFDYWDMLVAQMPEHSRIECELVCGGRSRFESVKNGLMAIPADSAEESLVAVHDAARPMLTTELVGRMWEYGAEKGAAIPAVPVTDSLRYVESDETSHAVDRSRFRAVQTPQTFRLNILRRGYELSESPLFTDDASVVEALGETVALAPGDPRNMKVTNPDDFAIAEILLRKNNH